VFHPWLNRKYPLQVWAGRRIELLSRSIVLPGALLERKFLLNVWPPEFMLEA
jgi:hypothetical protein